MEEILDATLPYWRYADRFGWTPSQVRQESYLEMWAIAQIDDVAEDLRNKARRQSETEQQVVEALGGGRGGRAR